MLIFSLHTSHLPGRQVYSTYLQVRIAEYYVFCLQLAYILAGYSLDLQIMFPVVISLSRLDRKDMRSLSVCNIKVIMLLYD